MVLERICERIRVRLHHPDDTHAMQTRKFACFWEAAVLFAVSLFVFIGGVPRGLWEGHQLLYMLALGLMATSAFLLFLVLTRRTVSDNVFVGVVAVQFVVICLHDLRRAGLGTRGYAVFVIFLDVLLVGRAPAHVFKWFVGYGVLWMVVMEAELFFRFGLLDVWGTSTTEQRRETWCDCATPPCARDDQVFIGFGAVASAVTVLVLDFVMTKEFATNAQAEQERMAAAITTARTIAADLACFDLDAAKEALLDASGLPDELRAAYERLLTNLASYRPYLPTEFFTDGSSPVAVPGIGTSSHAALVFTDVRQSTALWALSEGDAMEHALMAHDEIMRSAIWGHEGYEVKTIGDAFMVAFAHSSDAISFALEVQTELACMVWPEGVTRGDAEDEWDVFEVRIGVNCGDVSTGQNPLTKRYDYFGPTVNIAARVEAHGVPGAVTVTDMVMAELPPALLSSDRVSVIPFEGERHGKGLQQPLRLTALLPKAVSRKLPQVTMAVQAELLSPVSMRLEKPSPRRGSVQNRLIPMLASTRRKQVHAAICTMLIVPPPADSNASMGALCSLTPLERLCQCVANTHGQMSNVLNNVVLMSWNVFSRHTNAMQACRSFLTQYLGQLHVSERWLGAGVADGLVCSGSVSATATKQFMNVWGPAVDASMELAWEASRARTAVLTAVHGAPGDEGEAVSSLSFDALEKLPPPLFAARGTQSSASLESRVDLLTSLSTCDLMDIRAP